MEAKQCSKKLSFTITHITQARLCWQFKISNICWKRVKDVNPFCTFCTADFFSTRVLYVREADFLQITSKLENRGDGKEVGR